MQVWLPISFDSVPRDFLPLEDIDPFPDNDILNDSEKVFFLRMTVMELIRVVSRSESIPTQTSEKAGRSVSQESLRSTCIISHLPLYSEKTVGVDAKCSFDQEISPKNIDCL